MMYKLFLGKPCQKIIEWLKRPLYSIQVTSSDLSKGDVVGAGSFKKYTRTTIKALPNSGYVFKEWNDGNKEQIRNIVITSDKSFIAYFEDEKKFFTITVSSSDEELGTTTPNGSIQYEEGTKVTLKATPKKNEAGLDKGKFMKWSDENTNATREITVTENKTLTAIFEQNLGFLRYWPGY